jgi:Na+-translocating ferredoxin:NAD+ oxidoreductase RnfG subunit
MRLHRIFPLLLLASAWAPTSVAAQEVDRASVRLIQEVMPDADRFDEADGDPPVRRAYRGDRLIGYVFLTSDLPPQEQGYSGPIEALVGVDTAGVITGVRVTAYRESLRYSWGDFLNEPYFLHQFVGKEVTDPFVVRQDIDGISGVTISVRALARGVRTTARRVALAYVTSPEDVSEELSDAELVQLSWYDIQRHGVVASMPVRQTRRNPMELLLLWLSSEELGRHLVGSRYDALLEDVEEAGGADQVILYIVSGDVFAPPLREGWSIEQGGRTLELPRERVVTVGRPGGVLSGQSSQVGALLLDDDEIDIAAPMTFLFDRGRPDLGVASVDYTSRASFIRMAEAEAQRRAEDERMAAEDPAAAPEENLAAADEVVAAEEVSTPDAAPDAPEPATEPEPEAAVVEVEAPAVTASVPERPDVPELVVVSEDEMFVDAEAGPPWSRVGLLIFVIALALLAFVSKKEPLRWVSLAATMVLLGWVDGGFLSISHVTGLIWVGLSAVRSDLSLLILVGVTVATVVLWGRVFCGYLCPFGALQDFIDRLIPRRFKRELTPEVHRVAWKAKYVILALILGAALAGVQVSLYQYFEPFGTVFMVGSSVLLWLIAGGFLLASAVIPRFYCRYACPLGALLAVGSLLSLRRIRRVEQCDYCHVCEQRCPTGAIAGPTITFSECVRCNVCEIELIEQRGVCGHDMEEIRPRLVQIAAERAATGRPPAPARGA